MNGDTQIKDHDEEDAATLHLQGLTDYDSIKDASSSNVCSRRLSRKHLKLGFFKLINLMQEFSSVSTSLYILVLLLEFAMISTFLLFKLDVASQSSLKNAKTSTGNQHFDLGSWLNYLNIKQVLINNTNENESYVCLSLVLFFITANYLIQIFLCYYTSDGYMVLSIKSMSKQLLKISGIVQVMLLKVLVIPIFMILISHMICKHDETLTSDTSVMTNVYYSYQCWTIQHVFMVIVILSFMLVTSIYLLSLSMVFNDPRPDSPLPWAHSPSKAELIKTFIKIIIPVALNVEIFSSWIYLVFQIFIVLLAYMIVHYRYKYFFHANKTIYIATIIQESSILWLSCVTLIINQLLDQISTSTFAYLIMSLLFVDILMAIVFMQKDLDKTFTQYPNLTQEEEYQQFFMKLKRYMVSAGHKTVDRTLIFGLIKHHQIDCNDLNCVCDYLLHLMSSNKLELYLDTFDDKMLLQIQQSIGDDIVEKAQFSSYNDYDPNKYEATLEVQKLPDRADPKQAKLFEAKFHKMLFRFYYQLLTKAIAKFPTSMKLRYIQVNVLKHQLSNEFKAYFQIVQMQKERPTFEWDFFLYQCKQRVERIMYNKYQLLMNNKQGIDVIKVYEFEQMFLKFERQVINTANNCLNFWKELMENKNGGNVNRIHDFGVQIANSYSDVSDMTKKMLTMFPNHLMLLKIYAYFLSDVMNNEEEGQEINAKVKSFLQNQSNLQNQQQNTHDENKFFGYNTKTVIISMTVTHKDLGKMLNANFETKTLLGYKNREIKGKNVKIIMPKILSDNHDSFIKTYFETAKAKILEKQRIVLAKDKQGFVFPVHIVVKAIPNLRRDLIFVGFLKKVDETDPFMQPPSIFAGQDYHLIYTDNEGQIYGFTKNCWETFGFTPQFFFNRFGDPEQQIRMDKIIKNLKNPFFLSKLESKKDGVYCSLDTVYVMETISKELLTKDEQETLRTISGSYNINLQISEMRFADGKIALRIYKILKVSRIIRSQNVLDMIQSKVDEVNELSEDSLQEEGSTETQNHGNYGPRIDSIDIEDDILDGNDRKQELSERSVTSTINMSDATKSSKYLQSFKKSISNKSMPASIKKLNRIVILLVLLILTISFLDLIQSVKYYDFTKIHQNCLQLMHQKQNLMALMTTNILHLVMIAQNIQPNTYQNFTSRSDDLRKLLLQNIAQLDDIENHIQSQSYSSLYYNLDDYNPNTDVNIKSINQDTSVQADTQSMRYVISQYLAKLENMLVTQNQSDLKLTQEVYKIQNLSNSTTRTQNQKDLYFTVDNELFSIADTNTQQNQQFYEDLLKTADVYSLSITIQFAFCALFVVLSGIVVFPIVIGVQKNKVMILSIYFELPYSEIERSFRKCLYFMAKIESKLDDQSESKVEAQFAKKIIELEEQQKEQERQEAGGNEEDNTIKSSGRRFLGNDEDFDNPNQLDNSQQRIFSYSRKISFINQRSMTKRLGQNQCYSGSSPVNLGDLKLDFSAQQNNEPQADNVSSSSRQVDQSKIFREIKVRNNKINVITLLVIFSFLAYFATSFGVNKMYTINITKGLDQQQTIYQERSSLQLAYLYFLQEVMRNQTLPSTNDPTSQSQFEYYVGKIYDIQNLKENIKKLSQTSVTNGIIAGKASQFIDQIDSKAFCDEIDQYLTTDFTKTQCQYISDGTFTLGQKHTIITYLYQFQQLRIKFLQSRNSSQLLLSILQDPIMIDFSILSNIYLEASYKALMTVVWAAITDYYKRIMLFVELKFAFFIIFTILILTVVWRVFLKNIQAEIFRSKGMLNMIPIEFLEKENNLKNLSINKLIDVEN